MWCMDGATNVEKNMLMNTKILKGTTAHIAEEE